ncbi:RHS repeat-associated core domain-containing protein, partial [Sphingomonas sp. NCPPB 2930]
IPAEATEALMQSMDSAYRSAKALNPPQVRHFHCDHLGTPIAMTQATGERTGQLVWAARYDAWGAVVEECNPHAIDQPIRFQGQQIDAETGLHYNRLRYYETTTGSYLSPDPIGLDGDINAFTYVSGRPISSVDPLGLAETIYLPGDGRKLTDGPRNGNWCGGKWSGGMSGGKVGTAEPVDSMDEICKAHDLCYDNNTPKLTCDRELVKDLRSLPNDPKQWKKPPPAGTEFSSKGYRKMAIEIFK